MEQKVKQITKSVGVLSIATATSRILGYIRDAYNAFLFGAGIVSDAFFVAYRIPNMLRDLLAEGALSSAFIPTFVDYLEKKGKEEAFRLANIVISLLIILFSLIILSGIVLAPYIVKIMAPGFIPDAVNLTIKLSRILFPFIAFMGFASVFMGMLNSLKHSTIPALAPAVSNIVMILSGIFICPLFGSRTEEQIVGWAIGALFSGLIQVMVQLPSALKNGFKFNLLFDFKHKGIIRMTKIILPAIFSNSVGQLNIVLVNTVIASILGTATVTYLYYGFRLMQLPLGIFGVAIATATFPVISSHVARKEIHELKDTLSLSLRLNFFITIPATFGLISLSYPINNLLFHYGKFTEADTIATSYTAIFYTLGLSFTSCVKTLTPTFFALNDSKTPVKVGIVVILLNVFFSIILMQPLGFKGLAIASSISALLNFTFLFLILREKIGRLDESKIIISVIKIIAGSILMALVCLLSSDFFGKNYDLTKVSNRIIQVFVSIVSGIIVFVLISILLKVKEIKIFINMLKRRISKNVNAVRKDEIPDNN